MYLKSFKIKNFRKFGSENNRIEFVDAKSYHEQKQDEKINIAPTTTLIVGKNNSGKTTIISALDKLINKNGDYCANDFNFFYLKGLLDKYRNSSKSEQIVTPYLEFEIEIGIENYSNDLITNIIPFMVLDNIDRSEIKIIIKYELEDVETFNSEVEKIISISNIPDNIKFKKFLELIDKSEFKIKYYNSNNEVISKFNINNLIELRAIKANNIQNEFSLTKAFSTIIKYQFNVLFEEGQQDIDSTLTIMNSNLSALLDEKHTNAINKSLEKVESMDKLKVSLSSDITFQKLISELLKYEYIEQNNNIPENQFGLGYTNLMMIIADLIDYMEKYPDSSFNSKINLISIEEPETYMHPQMQELFIKNINDAIATLLEIKNKNVNSQLIITTHSSHILNSKIHTGNTFNHINYVTIVENHAYIVNLHDDIITPRTPKKENQNKNKEVEIKDKEVENNLKFLKKHIKYKVSELFFSDAIVFVEGVTEETLIKYYIDQNINLKKYYISVFNIDGAHGLIYHQLISLLNIPALIITDLDIKRDEQEKDTFLQISELYDRLTTNKTIKKYNKDSDCLKDLPKFIEQNNLYLAYQGQKIEGYFATSFEEAYILTNYKNTIVNDVIKKMKPKIYRDILGDNTRACLKTQFNTDFNSFNSRLRFQKASKVSCLKQNSVKSILNKKFQTRPFESIKNNSYKLQRKLSDSKSEFANELLYKYITEEDKELPVLPLYIVNGLEWIFKRLKGEK